MLQIIMNSAASDNLRTLVCHILQSICITKIVLRDRWEADSWKRKSRTFFSNFCSAQIQLKMKDLLWPVCLTPPALQVDRTWNHKITMVIWDIIGHSFKAIIMGWYLQGTLVDKIETYSALQQHTGTKGRMDCCRFYWFHNQIQINTDRCERGDQLLFKSSWIKWWGRRAGLV